MENKNKRLGFTLLEIIISLGIMILIVAAISQLYSTYLRLISDEKLKITAASLANQKIEIIRNLPYQKIGTLGGIPAGSIPQLEIVNRNGYDFSVKTEILYVDDPFDGTYAPDEVNNPYRIDNPEVIFYWNLDSVANNQAPQKGAGLITTAVSLTTTDGVINQAGYFNPGNQNDYVAFSIDENILYHKGRIGFWYRATNENISSDRYLFYLAGCNGEFSLKRKNSNKLELRYGLAPAAEYLSTHPQKWDNGQWYFIEVIWDADNGLISLLVNNEEIGFRTNEIINPPVNCTTAYIGNNSPYGTQNADGSIDEFYILNNPFPNNYLEDFLNTDYKRIKISVSWQTPHGEQKISLFTDVTPPSIETNAGGGTLIINVFDSLGLPVPQANVNINNQLLEPAIDLQLQTNNNGQIIIPGTPASNNYNIVVSKANYSTDKTYEATTEYPNPTRPLVNIIEYRNTEVSFAIDKLSNLTIRSFSRNLPGNWAVPNGPTTTPYYASKIVAGTNNFFNVWQDFREDINNSKTYAQAYSFNGTKLWTNDLSISPVIPQLNPDITVDNENNIYTIWQSDFLGQNDLYLNKHTVNGTDLWNGYKKATHNYSSNKTQPQIIIASSTIFIVWQDERNDNGDIYLNSLNTNGDFIFANDIKINTDNSNTKQDKPKIIKDADNNLVLAWLDNRNGQNDIYLTKISQQGNLIWSSEQQINSEILPVDQNNFSLTSDQANNIYLFWSDDRTGQEKIYWQKIDEFGNKFFITDQEFTTQANNAQSINPLIISNQNDQIFVAWQDNRNGQNDIFVNKIDLDGNSLWPQEQQINLQQDGDQFLSDLTIYQTNKLALTWIDWQTGVPTIWNATLADQLTENIIPYYKFTLTGTKKIYNSPDLLKYKENLQTNSQGILIINNLEWDSYQVTNNDQNYNLILTEPSTPLLLPAETSTELKLIID